MGQILAVGAKEMRQILRDRRTLLILLFIPAFFLLLYGYALSFDIRNVHLAVQDRDRSMQSRELVSAFVNSGYFALVGYEDSDAALARLVDEGQVRAILSIPPHFERDLQLKRPVTVQVVIDGDNANTAATVTGYARTLIAEYGAVQMVAMLSDPHLRQGYGGQAPVGFITGDMTDLPLRSASFDLVTTGYGLRNVPDLNLAIDEIARVLRPGGRLLSLDFNRPESAWLRSIYLSYLTVVGATLGWLLHRDPDTYRYIPASIRRYPGAAGVASLLTGRGFTGVRVVPLLFGLMTLHLAQRSR